MQASSSPQAVGRLGHLGREDIAGLQLLHPLEGLLRGQHPARLAVLHQHHMLAEVGDILGVVLNDKDGLAMVLIQIPEDLIDPVGVQSCQTYSSSRPSRPHCFNAALPRSR